MMCYATDVVQWFLSLFCSRFCSTVAQESYRVFFIPTSRKASYNATVQPCYRTWKETKTRNTILHQLHNTLLQQTQCSHPCYLFWPCSIVDSILGCFSSLPCFHILTGFSLHQINFTENFKSYFDINYIGLNAVHKLRPVYIHCQYSTDQMQGTCITHAHFNCVRLQH